jgi:hypothetical protein
LKTDPNNDVPGPMAERRFLTAVERPTAIPRRVKTAAPSKPIFGSAPNAPFRPGENQTHNMNKLLVSLAGLAIASAAFAQVDPARPMVTGRGNVAAQPAKVIVTNQTMLAAKAEEPVALEHFVVTGSLLRKPGPATPRR